MGGQHYLKKEQTLGTFLSKEQLKIEAERLGVNLEGLSYQEQQKAIFDAKKEANEDIHYEDETTRQKKIKREAERDREIPDVEFIISAEIAPTRNQLIKYDEELGEDLITEEISLNTSDAGNNYRTATYSVKPAGRKVVAQSTAPKENCGIRYNPKRDWVPRTIWQGKVGYIYSHPSLPNIKDLLVASGYYEEYKDKIGKSIWYAASKIPTIDIGLTNQIFKEIEKKHAREHRGE